MNVTTSLYVSSRRAFSMMELLVVIAIMTILAVVALPALKGTNSALQVTSSSQRFADALSLAGQSARTRNMPVSFCIYQLPDPTNVSQSIWRAYQCYYVNDDGSYTPVNQVAYLPTGVIFNTSSSPLVTDPSVGTTITASGFIKPPSTVTYSSFQFNSDGSLGLSSSPGGGTGPWFVTIQGEHDQIVANGLPANWAEVQIDPVIGTVKVTRP
jgi:uncharacterized protein (TIGR02596 family)